MLFVKWYYIHEENVEHLLYTCSKLSGIWEDIVQFTKKNNTEPVFSFEIWRRRNVFRNESILIDPLIIEAKIKYEVKCHFQILAKKICSKYVKRCIEPIFIDKCI